MERENALFSLKFHASKTLNFASNFLRLKPTSPISYRSKLWSNLSLLLYHDRNSNASTSYENGVEIWLRGKLYIKGSEEERNGEYGSFREFQDDYYNYIWLTYRVGMPPLCNSEVTTDCGWGCTLRCGQMLIANTLLLLHLGRDRKLSKCAEDNTDEEKFNIVNIVSLFIDDPSAHLSLHRLLDNASKMSMGEIGAWHSVGSACFLLRRALSHSDSSISGRLIVHIVNCGYLLRDELPDISSYFERPVLLIIILRLGESSINECYSRHLINLMKIGNCVGVIGGKPNHSLYFIGAYGEKELIYLDPHTAQKALTFSSVADGSSYHCSHFSKAKIKSLDPCCGVGFLMRSQSEFDSTIERLFNFGIIDIINHGQSLGYHTEFPLFTVLDEPLKGLEDCISFETDQNEENEGFIHVSSP